MSGNLLRRGALALLLSSSIALTTLAERINQEDRILGPEPVVTTPTLFNAAAGDSIVSAMQIRAIQDTGAAPSDDAEPAILVDLNPGNYTAVVSGVNGGTGTALAEAYYIQ